MTDCHYCGAKMIWEADFDGDEWYPESGIGAVAVLTCPACGARAVFDTGENHLYGRRAHAGPCKPFILPRYPSSMEGVYLLLTPAELRAWQFEEGDETLLGRPNIEVPNIDSLEHASENIAYQLASLANAKGMTTAFVVEMTTRGNDFAPPVLAGRLYKGYAPQRGYAVIWRVFRGRDTLENIEVPEELLTTCFNQDAVFDMFEFLRGAREGLSMNKTLFEWVKGGFSEYYSAQELGRIMMVRGLTAMRDDLEIIDDVSYDGPRAEGLR